MGESNPIRQWEECEGPSPFKLNEGGSMRTIQGLDEPSRIRPDQMHVFAYGYGKDFAASSVMLCARLKIWPGRSIPARLEHAFQNFRSWCKRHKKSTSLKTFDNRVFKTGQNLDWARYNKGVPPCWDSLYTYGKSSKPVAPTNNTTLASKGLQWMANWLWQSLWCNLDFQMDWGGIDWWLWHSSLHQIWIYKGYKLLVWDTPSSKYFLEFHFHFFLCIHPCHKAPENTDLFEVIRWTLKHTSVFFRDLHKSGIWLSLDLARKAAASGWSMTDSSIWLMIGPKLLLNPLWNGAWIFKRSKSFSKWLFLLG